MGHGRNLNALWVIGATMLLLFATLVNVHPSLSLPTLLWVAPPPWRVLVLSQGGLGPLFSNSSPFSSSHSLLMLPPPGRGPRALLRASFGPFVVSQMISEHLPPLSSPLSAFLLSEGVELDPGGLGGAESHQVRVLFQVRGEGWSVGSCLTLHAFRETQERSASCRTQPPLGVCMVTLTLPSDWFESQYVDLSYLSKRLRRVQQPRHYRPHGPDASLEAPRRPRAPGVQLYYSSVGPGPEGQTSSGRCAHGRVSQSELSFFRSLSLTAGDGRPARNTTVQEEACLGGQEGEELHLDPNVLIHYHRGPMRTGQPAGVRVSLRANLSVELVTIRLKVKRGLVSMAAKQTLTSDLWAVTLERMQGAKHDVIAIICRKHTLHTHTVQRPRHSASLHQQVACVSVDALRWRFRVALRVAARWWVQYSGGGSGRGPAPAAVNCFTFTQRPVVGIAPIMESDTIINTAILGGQPVSLPVRVMAIGRDGKMSDVTAAASCQSSDENIIKVSSDCSSLFVDGSESGEGSTCVRVEFGLGALRGAVCLRVWAPAVPLRLSVSDPVLNAIQGWSKPTPHGCSAVFQRASVQVLTQFKALDTQGGITHLMGSSDWLVDVTELVSDWLRVEDPQVAFLGKDNILIGLEPGKTTLQVVSGQWDGLLGSCDITVTFDPVSPSHLSVQLVSGLGMSVRASLAHPSALSTTVSASNTLERPGQEASVSVWVQFDDDSSSLLSSFSGLPFSLQLSSLAESVVAVVPGSAQRVVARGDGGGPLLRAELLVPDCTEHTLNANILSEAEVVTRRLAGGSGWIRVHLDLEPLQPISSQYLEGEELELDISDTLVDANANFYPSNQELDAVVGGNQTHADYYGGRTLERVVWTQQRGDGGGEGEERGGDGGDGWRGGGQEEERWEGEIDLGVGTLLSLICLSSLLFLVNCLPCSLLERRRKRRSPKGGGGEEKGEDERGRREGGGEVEVKERERKEV